VRSVLRNLVVRVATLFPAAVASLLGTRLLLQHYDVEVFNAYTLIFSLMLLIPLNDLGAGAALTTAVAEDGADHPHTRRVALTAARTLTASGLGLAALALALTGLGWWDDLLGGGAATTGAFGVAIALYGLSFVPGLGQSVLLGVNKNELTILTQASLPPAMAAGVGVCVLFDASPAWVVVVPGVAMLLISLLNAWVAGHETPLRLLGLLPQLLGRRRHPGAKISGIAGPALIVLLLGPITLQSDRLVLSHFGTADDVAVYSVGLQMFSPLFAIIPAAARPLWPIFAQARVTGTKTVSLFKVILLFAAGTFVVAGGLVAVSGPVARVVSDGEIDIGIAVPLLFASGTMIQAITVPMAMALMYPAGLRVVARLSLIATPINLVGSILVAGSLGAAGPLYVGAVVTVILQMIPAALYLMRHGLGPPERTAQPLGDRGPELVPASGDLILHEGPLRAQEVSDAPRTLQDVGRGFDNRWRETEAERSW
jgi:O-antigen/teichoic acid export membrane protein